MRHDLDAFFSPHSIAVIGASDRAASVGMKVFNNLLEGQFKGNIYPVNPKYARLQGQVCYASVTDIHESIDLVIIATPARSIPSIIQSCAIKQISAAIILSSGFSEADQAGKALEQDILAMAKQFHIRIIGPNCLGVMRPHIKMNASFDNNMAMPGKLALVSQSGAISASILDWAVDKKIGFSALISLGNNADVNFGDMLDFLAQDEKTESIFMYIEGVHQPRHFMNALRYAASVKPVIVLKAGKNAQGSRAALSHTGALIGSDDVFDAVLRQTGAVRIQKIEDLFSVAELLAGTKKVKGNRLAIISNGGGAGVIAADRAAELNIALPGLNADVIAALDKVLPAQWSHQNPIDIIGDATPERYHATLNIIQQQMDVDAILNILVPVAMSEPLRVAEQVIHDAKKSDKLFLNCWMGEKQVNLSWNLFAKHHIPCFSMPEQAIESFAYLAAYYHNQQLLAHSLRPSQSVYEYDRAQVKAILQSVRAEQRLLLKAMETKALLKVFGIQTMETFFAANASDAMNVAKKLAFPLVMKIDSPDITHKSAAGGVYINIANEMEIYHAYETMVARVRINHPDARIHGVTLESQCVNRFDREIMIGVINDIVFGPVISFGAGGTLVELIHDRVLALPPLDDYLANYLLTTSRILQPAGKLHQITTQQRQGIIDILMRVSAMVAAIPEMKEMDINPLILTETGLIAVDGRMVLTA